MGTSKLREKLEEYFGYDENRQKEKQKKLLKIITKLENQQNELEQDLMQLPETEANSETVHDMQMELEVIKQLIEKAKSGCRI